jgi:hypothetical protein
MQLQDAAAALHRGCRWRSSCVLLLVQSLTQPLLSVQLPVLQTQGMIIMGTFGKHVSTASKEAWMPLIAACKYATRCGSILQPAGSNAAES